MMGLFLLPHLELGLGFPLGGQLYEIYRSAYAVEAGVWRGCWGGSASWEGAKSGSYGVSVLSLNFGLRKMFWGERVGLSGGLGAGYLTRTMEPGQEAGAVVSARAGVRVSPKDFPLGLWASLALYPGKTSALGFLSLGISLSP